jgi:hypothetical protein
MFRSALVALALLTLAACSAAPPPRTLPATLDSSALPAAARAALEAAWPKAWSVAPLGASVASCLSGKPAGTIVTSDFDSDGATDLAAAISTPQGVRLVVLMQRDDHYALFNVDALGDQGGAGLGLGLAKRGVTFTKADSLFHDFYPADTLTAYGCSGPTVSYLWGGLDFYKVTLAPATAAAR